jgi:predicted lipid-binding transport protein (Tim44 family)
MAHSQGDEARLDEVSPQGPPTGPSLRPTGEKARQGQNIRGMVAVLIVGVLLVVLAFGVMLTMRSEPPSVTNTGKDAAAAATSNAYPSTPDASQTQAPPASP